jgi:predicted nucleotidyltransferase
VEIIRKYTGNETQIILFGSRARHDCLESSDYDICLKSTVKLGVKKALIKEALEESTVPYKVDIVDYNEAGTELKRIIDREGVPCS